MALQNRLMVPVCLHCRIPLPSVSPVSSSSSINAASGGRISHSTVVFPSYRAAGRKLMGGQDSSFLKGLCIVFSRNLTGRAQTRAASAIAKMTAFSTEEVPVKEAGTILEGGEEVEGNNLDGNMRKLPGSNIIMDVNMGRRHLVKQAVFIKSSPRVSECPKDGLPEFALVGRSNVGKSSLVNALVNRKELAQTSKTPGKTQLINHYRINNNWYLVDLPGYGYAKAPTAVKTGWNEFTKSYFLNRKTLVAVLLLVDGSLPPMQIDLDCANWLGRNKIPVTLVFTKCDRRKKRKNGGRPPDENVKDFEQKLLESYDQTPPWIMTSSSTGQGKEELLKHMARLLDYWNN